MTVRPSWTRRLLAPAIRRGGTLARNEDGAVLIDNRVIEELQVPVRPEHFFEPLHQRIYERVLVLIERNATASPVTLRPYFEADPQWSRHYGFSPWLTPSVSGGLS